VGALRGALPRAFWPPSRSPSSRSRSSAEASWSGWPARGALDLPAPLRPRAGGSPAAGGGRGARDDRPARPRPRRPRERRPGLPPLRPRRCWRCRGKPICQGPRGARGPLRGAVPVRRGGAGAGLLRPGHGDRAADGRAGARARSGGCILRRPAGGRRSRSTRRERNRARARGAPLRRLRFRSGARAGAGGLSPGRPHGAQAGRAPGARHASVAWEGTLPRLGLLRRAPPHPALPPRRAAGSDAGRERARPRAPRSVPWLGGPGAARAGAGGCGHERRVA